MVRGSRHASPTGAPVPHHPESVRWAPGRSVVPPAEWAYPRGVIGAAAARRQNSAMQHITPSRAPQRQSIAPLLTGTVLGTLLVVGGLVLAWLALATPFLRHALPGGRPDPGQMAMGMAIWAIALVGPAGFILFGTARLARNLASVKRYRPRRSPVVQALAGLPEDVIVASEITLPDGRGVGDLVVGAFGAAVIRELPPAAVTRVRGDNWEVRGARGWIPLDNPMERAVRDAERVRRWLGHDDMDFVVKVYTAVVGPAPTLERTTACAVLTPDTVASWITGLPPQRSLTSGRRDQLIEMVREAAR